MDGDAQIKNLIIKLKKNEKARFKHFKSRFTGNYEFFSKNNVEGIVAERKLEEDNELLENEPGTNRLTVWVKSLGKSVYNLILNNVFHFSITNKLFNENKEIYTFEPIR